MTISERIAELVGQEGSLRNVAAMLGADVGYLSRLASGHKTNPSERLLRCMGLRRVVTYERREVK